MIYEWRAYHAQPGQSDALLERFNRWTLPIMTRLGFRVLGFWESLNSPNAISYCLLQWEDEAEMEHAWASFQEDSEWISVKASTEKAGPLIGDKSTTLLKAVSQNLGLHFSS